MTATIKDITDAQVLTQLRIRKLHLQLQLERVEIAIRAFENIKDIDPLDAVFYELDEPHTSTGIKDELASAILMYNPKMTAEKKIEYVLNQIRSGDAADITEYLLKVDGHIKNTKKLFNNITYVASRMYKAGKIDADKAGKKNKYKLKSF